MFDKNQTEFPSEKHEAIWKTAMNYLPEDITLTDEMKAFMDPDLFESCKQMRTFVMFALEKMYEGTEVYDFMPYHFLYQSLVDLIDKSEDDVSDGLILNKSKWSKQVTKRYDEMLKRYAVFFVDTGMKVTDDSDKITITNTLYPKMFRAMKELRSKKAKHGGEIFFKCDFRKLCDGIKHKKQTPVKSPGIIEVAKGFLSAENLASLTELNDFLVANKMTPRDTKAGGTWAVRHKNNAVCHIRLKEAEKSWTVSFGHFTKEEWFVDYDKYITDDGLINFIWSNIQSPLCTDRDCWSKNNKMTILGKNFDAVCYCVGFRIINPNDDEINYLKKLILIIKGYIINLGVK